MSKQMSLLFVVALLVTTSSGFALAGTFPYYDDWEQNISVNDPRGDNHSAITANLWSRHNPDSTSTLRDVWRPEPHVSTGSSSSRLDEASIIRTRFGPCNHSDVGMVPALEPIYQLR